ncbi:YaiO family outer membrane beta-barrel protein [Algoriphagus sp. CAU 1675]|uniref:YaiO family outer membrane beta-barrel protein n=1 Tax=Algoriphagus sp. CAU 1675 TaxID=3032597 RepID=UPI0023DABB64|nr:YaiO family outer membrane beta-barrel protein [Algoriphagus sp. CAU 1675]MDF2157810.1 YaiO family outer membrane beta-barrel protein [Algoriphagus sp. CAU 1675]
MRKFPVLLILLISLVFQVKAQDRIDPDELLIQARELIFDGKYIEGRTLAFRALEKFPTYGDILILVGRSYAWEGKNDSASMYLERAIVAAPKYEDAYSAFLDNLTWSGNYEKANEVLTRAKSNFGEKLPDNLRYKESRLLYFQEEYDDAFKIAEELFEGGFKQEGILGYMQTLQRLRKTNAIGATYDYDSFSGDLSLNPWNTWSFYGRTKTKLTGSLIARVTQSSRFDSFGTLYELDAYPSLGKNSYAYLNVGGSSASFFPDLRWGASVYFNLSNAWEIDGGYRYLKFSEVTNIITGSLGKYLGNWWMNMRVNVIPSSNGTSSSAIFQSRYYFKTGEDFFSIQLSSGVSPDEENRDFSQLLNSYRVRLGYQQLISPRFMIYGYTGYSRDELSAGNFRNNLNISLGTEYRF